MLTRPALMAAHPRARQVPSASATTSVGAIGVLQIGSRHQGRQSAVARPSGTSNRHAWGSWRFRRGPTRVYLRLVIQNTTVAINKEELMSHLLRLR